MDLRVRRVATMDGQFRPPSDKSLTHRAYMLGAIADGPSLVRRALVADDCESTLRCLMQMGLRWQRHEDDLIELRPPFAWSQPEKELDCGNSGTTMRLLSGLIASRPIRAVLTGDESLRRRPMRRIADPLRRMGVDVDGDRPPLTIQGREDLEAIRHVSSVASAQVKSCVLFAGMGASGATTVVEPHLSRDHTERMLKSLGVDLEYGWGLDGLEITLHGKIDRLPPFEFEVPGDPSSAAFLLVAAALLPEARVRAMNVGLNPTRTGFLKVFEQAEVSFFVEERGDALGEPYGDIEVSESPVLMPFEVNEELAPWLIDEVPILAVLATQCDGVSTFRGVEELRVKESDRIAKMADGLTRMGAHVELVSDGFAVHGPALLHGTTIEADHDHRIAMAFAVAGLLAEGETVVKGAEAIATSYPAFEQDLWSLCVW